MPRKVEESACGAPMGLAPKQPAAAAAYRAFRRQAGVMREGALPERAETRFRGSVRSRIARGPWGHAQSRPDQKSKRS